MGRIRYKKQNNQKAKGLLIGAYIRVSTEEQAQNPEGSIKNQIERIKSTVKLKNENGRFGDIVEFYTDRAKSGKDTNRSELQRMLKDIRERRVNFVVVTELSRISRSIKDFSEIWEMFQEHGCGFLSLRESFDTSTAAGEMLLYNMANLAQFERRQVVERVTAGLEARAARGLYNGGPVPVGYLIGKEKGTLDVDKGNALIVQKAFKVYLDEESLSTSAKRLNQMGLRIPRAMQGGGKSSRLGFFTVDNLHTILRNKAYIGVRVYRSKGEFKETKAIWPGIVDQITFERVQKKLGRNHSRKKPRTIASRYPYLLSGITYCAQCKDVMCGKSAHGNSGKVPYYEHGWAQRKQSVLAKPVLKCDPHRVPGRILEAAVWEKVEELLANSQLANHILAEARRLHRERSKSTEFDRQKDKVRAVDSQLEALAERLAQLPKTVSAAPVYKQMEKLEMHKRAEEDRLNHLSQSQVQMDLPAEFGDFQNFLSGLKKLRACASDARHKIVERLIHKVEIKPDGFILHYHAGIQQIKRESEKSDSLPIFLSKIGSRSLTNGDPGKN